MPSARRRKAPILPLLLALLLPACSRQGDSSSRQPGPMRVVASIPPLESLARQLAPPGAQITSIIPPGESPHTFEPKPSDLNDLARADLIVIVGLGVEASLPRDALRAARTLSMADALGFAPIPSEDATPDHHEHDHGGLDPHLWLDPVLVEQFIPALAARIQDADSSPSDDASARETALLERVRAVDAAYRERLAPYAGATIITQHGAWSRLAERYGLRVCGIIQDTESLEPSAKHVADLLILAKTEHVRAVFTEPQLEGSIARRVAGQLGVPIGSLDPIGAGDWATTMLANLDAITTALGAPTAPAPEPPPG
ncbi:MAG: zinc ABC transporter substrate-binding protein [Phycisphaerales bacterium]|nr:zinc ABC transporter substrate-binding protein [Phycisphaerales bacterium]